MRRSQPWEERLGGLPTEPVDGGLVLHVARGHRARRRGLARMAPMPAWRGLRIARCRSVHTFGMRFALDLVWLGPGGGVLRVDRDVGPGRVALCPRARAVIEILAGHGERFAAGLERGPRSQTNSALDLSVVAILARVDRLVRDIAAHFLKRRPHS
jgi:uncharacterized protein